MNRLKKLKYYLFGERKALTLKNFRELSEIDADRGLSLVQDDRSGKVYMQRQLKQYDLAKYQYLKKRPVDNTPKIALLDETDGVLTVIEEYVPGDSLEFILKKKGVMDDNKVIDIARQLCVILNNFHHCKSAITGHNLNAANIKISVNGTVMLLETNVEKYNRKDAKVDDLPASDRYYAPEKSNPDSCGVLMDIYSLGVLMNVLLTGKHPEDGITESALRAVIEKCTAPCPNDRYANAMELNDALAAVKRSFSFRERLSSWNRYLLPGLRGKNAHVSFFAVMAYPMLIYICFGLNYGSTVAFGFLNRLVVFLCVMALVLFNGNYLNVQKRCFLTSSRRRFLHWLGMLLVNAFIIALTYGAFMLLSLIK